MYKFSPKSKERLSECHIDLQVLFNEVIKTNDCSVLCGYRGMEDQNRAFSMGFSKLKYPKSKHNKKPSLAADVIPYPISWTDKARFIEFGNEVLSIADRLFNEGKITHRIEWGGTWVNFQDLPHFQIVG